MGFGFGFKAPALCLPTFAVNWGQVDYEPIGPWLTVNAGLTKANLTGADLTGADLTGANLALAVLTDAIGLD